MIPGGMFSLSLVDRGSLLCNPRLTRADSAAALAGVDKKIGCSPESSLELDGASSLTDCLCGSVVAGKV